MIKYRKNENNGDTSVINILDKDDFDTNPADSKFVKEVPSFCGQNQYELVWFVRGIEHVLLDQSVENNKKITFVANFKRIKEIINVSRSKLCYVNPCCDKSSNILLFLDKYLLK